MIIWIIIFFTFQSFLPCKNTRRGSFCVWGYLFSCFPTPYCWMLSPLQSWGRWVRFGGPPVPLILDRPPQYWNSPHGPLPPPTPTHPHPFFPRYFAFPPKPMWQKVHHPATTKFTFYSKLHTLSKIHSRLSAVIKSHGKYDSWHTFQEVWLWPQGAEAVSFKIHLKHFSWRNFVRENGFWTYLI